MILKEVCLNYVALLVCVPLPRSVVRSSGDTCESDSGSFQQLISLALLYPRGCDIDEESLLSVLELKNANVRYTHFEKTIPSDDSFFVLTSWRVT